MKTKIIGGRVSEELEQLFLNYAEKHKWSKSFALSEILRQFFLNELTGDLS